ncbi:MAG: SDR family oxidoreductase [Fretibacterium sp.]|nr:SDR family oxidoreductase [Fretibacterium sp.]
MGRTIIITGTRRGIGKAILERFAEEADVTILAHARKETPEFADGLRKIEEERGCKIEPLYFDLRNSDEIKEALSRALKEYKKIDVLVNNAAVVMPSQSFLMASMEMIRESFEVNFFAQVQITQMVCRAMIRNKSGAVVNMASVAAFSGVEGQFEYVCGKAALVGMTRRLANELAPHHIRVNAVAPGMIDTDMLAQMEPEMRGKLLEHSIARRMGKPEEIANAVYFLASGEASFVNGQALLVNGGGIAFDA